MTTPTASASGGFDLGTISGNITLNAGGAFSTIQQLRGQISGFLNSTASAFQNVGGQISGFGASFTQMMAPFALGMGAGIKAASGFQDSLTEIQARTGLTNEAMEEVRATALRLGADTKFSSQQALDAFLQLLTAGMDKDSAMAALPAILDGAAASGADLGYAADLVTNILSSFNLEASETERVVNLLNGAAATSPATMMEIGESLQLAGGMAREFGLEIEDANSIMNILAQQGIRGSEAYTQFRSIMTSMSSPTANTAEAWDLLGTSLYNADGSMRNMDDVLSDIRAGMANLNDEQRAFVTQNLAGSYGRVGFNALLMSDGIEATNEVISQQASAAEVARKKMENFSGQIISLKGSIEALLITAFTPFIEEMTPFVEKAIEIVNSITAWIEANQAIVQPMLRMVAMLILLGPTLFAVGKAISFVGFLIGALTSPINLALIAVTAFVAAWSSDFMGLRTRLQPIFDAIGNAVGSFFRLLEGNATIPNAISQALITFASSLGIPLQTILAIQNTITPVFDAIKSGLSTVGTMIEWFIFHVRALWHTFTTFGFESGMTYIKNNLVDPLVKNIQNVNWSEVATSVMSGLSTAFTTAVTWATWVYDNILKPLFDNAVLAIANVDWFAVGSGIVTGIGNAIKATFDFVAWIIDSIFNPVVSDSENAANGIDWGNFGNAIMHAIGSAIGAVINFVSWIGENIISPLILGAAAAIQNFSWDSIGTNLMSAIANALPNIGQWVNQNIIQPIRNALSNFNPLDALQMGITGGEHGIRGSFTTARPPQYGGSFATGTNFVPRDMLAMIHQGEAIVPREYNPAAGGSGGGTTWHVTIQATPGTDGRQVARDFQSELEYQFSVNG